MSCVATFNGQIIGPSLVNGMPFTLGGYIKEKATHQIRLYLQTEALDTREDSFAAESEMQATHTARGDSDGTSRNTAGTSPAEAIVIEEDTLPDLSVQDTDVRLNTIFSSDHQQLQESDRQQDENITESFPRSRLRLRPRLFTGRQATFHSREMLRDAICRLEGKLNLMSKNIINVDGNDVLDGAFRAFGRKSFDPWKRSDVRFVGEEGIDGSGPFREFLRLVLKAATALSIFRGEHVKQIVLDYNGLNKNLYFKVGQIIAYCLVHRGPFPQCFSHVMCSAISGEAVKPGIKDISDSDIQQQVRAIQDAETSDEFQSATYRAEQLVDMAGCATIALHGIRRKNDLVEAICKFVVVDKIRLPVEQFQAGLDCLGLAEEIHNNHKIWREVFVAPESPLGLDHLQVEALFRIVWSEEGGNRRRAETRTISYWRDFLQDLQDGTCGPLTG